MPTSLLNRVRRNHALEHATINVLTQIYPHAQVVGLSDPAGFTLHTPLSIEKVTPAIKQALARLQAGEHNLRIHPHCGTNLVVTATMTTLATLIGIGVTTERRQRMERLPQAVLLNVLALLVARPVATWVQAHISTDADMHLMQVIAITASKREQVNHIRVRTTQGD